MEKVVVTALGVVLTSLYCLVVVFLAEDRWDELARMDLDSLGTFLGGMAGPIALIWLVLGYLQQGKELRNNVRALRLQTEQFQRSVKQQAELLEETRLQTRTQLASIDAEWKARRASASPRFLFFSSGVSTGTGGISALLYLRNKGKIAYDVNVLVILENNTAAMWEWPCFPENETADFELGFEPNQVGDYRAMVRYVNGLGELVQDDFDFSIKEEATHKYKVTIKATKKGIVDVPVFQRPRLLD